MPIKNLPEKNQRFIKEFIRFVQLAESQSYITQSAKRDSFTFVVISFAVYRQRLFIRTCGLFGAIKMQIRCSQTTERISFPIGHPDFLKDLQRTLKPVVCCIKVL